MDLNGETCLYASKWRVLRDFNELPEEKQRQAVDFVEFLRAKTDKGLEGMMDAIIEENYDALRELGK